MTTFRQRDKTGTRTYRFLKEDTDRHGNVRLYFRRGGEPKVRLHTTPGTPEFEAEYLRAYAGEVVAVLVPGLSPRRAPADQSTFRFLAERYLASAGYKRLAHDTRQVRRRILDALVERAGHLPFAEMPASFIAKVRDEKAETPEAANSYLKAFRQVFSWACEPTVALATVNPAREVKYLDSDNPDGHTPWTEADIVKFEVHFALGTKARLALDLMQFTGVRVSDALRLGPQMERDGRLHFTEHKGRKKTPKHHRMPIIAPLRRSIDARRAALRGEGCDVELCFVPTKYGRPYSDKGFGQWFVRQARLAGIEDGKTAHGVRKLVAIRAAENGATEHQLTAFFGWTTMRQAMHYTKAANRARLESDAAAILAVLEPPDDETEADQSKNRAAAI